MILEISLYVYFFLWLKNVKMKLLIIDDDCYIWDSGRGECYTNYYVHVINPMTRENKTKEANWEGIHGWIYLNEHTVISIHVDKMIIYNY